MLPTSCGPVFLACNAVNPMSNAFKAPFSIHNALHSPISVTPIGTVGEEGKRRQLPILRNSPLYLRSEKRKDFVVEPGQTLVLHYDWDDINFSEILVRGDGWEGMLIVNPSPTEHQYTLPLNREFEVSDRAKLTPLSLPVREAASRPDGTPTRLRWVFLCGCVAPILYFYSRRKLRQTRDEIPVVAAS